MRKYSASQRGFTMAEALVSLAMGTIFLASVMSAWVYSARSLKEEGMRSKLRYNLEKSVEKIKEDFRLSDGGKILFYPTGSSSYTAVSLPREYANNNGLYDMGTGITWQDTIIYHVYSNEMRRTKLAYNSSSATRQLQLDDIALNGGDTLGGGGTTSAMFSGNVVTMDLTPTTPEFDGYSASLTKSSGTSFGFGAAILSPGTHTVRFQVTGKNTSSTGYRFGLDNITLTPSGCSREAEGMTITADSGKTQNIEDMSFFSSAGTWGGNNQLEYQASSIGDYVDFQVYNDEWLESNFADVTHTYTEITGTDPVLTVSSRENQGLSPYWRADLETDTVSSDTPARPFTDTSFRNIISGSAFSRDSTMVRFKFTAADSGPDLQITSAYFGERNGTSENFSVAPTAPIQLYFANATVPSGGTDDEGASGATGPTTVDIPAGSYIWSNWMTFPITTPAAGDYLVGFSVAAGSTSEETFWDGGSGTHSYRVDGQGVGGAFSWANTDLGYATDDTIYALEEMQSWSSSGTAVSQVYDTTMTAPAFSTVSWSTNGTGTYAIKVRSANNPQMTGASDWSALSAVTASPAAIAGSGNDRYVQWQATLTASSPFTTYPELDNLSIRWPGQNTLVELSGYFTKRPNYGKFKVQIDGVDVVDTLELDLTASETSQGKEQTYEVTAEAKPKNTGK